MGLVDAFVYDSLFFASKSKKCGLLTALYGVFFCFWVCFIVVAGFWV